MGLGGLNLWFWANDVQLNIDFIEISFLDEGNHGFIWKFVIDDKFAAIVVVDEFDVSTLLIQLIHFFP